MVSRCLVRSWGTRKLVLDWGPRAKYDAKLLIWKGPGRARGRRSNPDAKGIETCSEVTTMNLYLKSRRSNPDAKGIETLRT